MRNFSLLRRRRPTRMPVESAALGSAAYDERTQALYVWLKNGSRRLHRQVHPDLADVVMTGDYFGFYYRTHLDGGQVRTVARILRWTAAVPACVLFLMLM